MIVPCSQTNDVIDRVMRQFCKENVVNAHSSMGLKKDLLLVLTIESVVLGVVIGFVIRPFNPRFALLSQKLSNDTISLIGFPGEIFMQIVEMMILPLIISSVISDQIRNMFPENIIQATFQQVQTYYVPIKPKLQRMNGTTNITDVVQKPQLTYTNEMNVLGASKCFE
uniref:Amino acid transporter n=1 Tax=Heterorhabditis bacteriophora TaxID=37862 RepID=A0A1I7W7V8_HETBA